MSIGVSLLCGDLDVPEHVLRHRPILKAHYLHKSLYMECGIKRYPHKIKDFGEHDYAIAAEFPDHPPEFDVHRLRPNGLCHHVSFFP